MPGSKAVNRVDEYREEPKRYRTVASEGYVTLGKRKERTEPTRRSYVTYEAQKADLFYSVYADSAVTDGTGSEASYDREADYFKKEHTYDVYAHQGSMDVQTADTFCGAASTLALLHSTALHNAARNVYAPPVFHRRPRKQARPVACF